MASYLTVAVSLLVITLSCPAVANHSAVPPSTVQALFFAAPGNGALFAARDGVYGIAADFRQDGGAAVDWLPVGFSCLDVENEYDDGRTTEDDVEVDGLRVRSMSYDPVSEYLLLDLVPREEYASSFTLVTVRPCGGGTVTGQSGESELLPRVNCSLVVGNGTAAAEPLQVRGTRCSVRECLANTKAPIVLLICGC
jgi:hypothetical protein